MRGMMEQFSLLNNIMVAYHQKVVLLKLLALVGNCSFNKYVSKTFKK